MAQEVYKGHAHTVAYVENSERFMNVAKHVNENHTFSYHVTSKSIDYGYELIEDKFNKKDARDQLMSGVGGEVGDLDELLER